MKKLQGPLYVCQLCRLKKPNLNILFLANVNWRISVDVFIIRNLINNCVNVKHAMSAIPTVTSIFFNHCESIYDNIVITKCFVVHYLMYLQQLQLAAAAVAADRCSW